MNLRPQSTSIVKTKSDTQSMSSSMSSYHDRELRARQFRNQKEEKLQQRRIELARLDEESSKQRELMRLERQKRIQELCLREQERRQLVEARRRELEVRETKRRVELLRRYEQYTCQLEDLKSRKTMSASSQYRFGSSTPRWTTQVEAGMTASGSTPSALSSGAVAVSRPERISSGFALKCKSTMAMNSTCESTPNMAKISSRELARSARTSGTKHSQSSARGAHTPLARAPAAKCGSMSRLMNGQMSRSCHISQPKSDKDSSKHCNSAQFRGSPVKPCRPKSVIDLISADCKRDRTPSVHASKQPHRAPVTRITRNTAPQSTQSDSRTAPIAAERRQAGYTDEEQARLALSARRRQVREQMRQAASQQAVLAETPCEAAGGAVTGTSAVVHTASSHQPDLVTVGTAVSQQLAGGGQPVEEEEAPVTGRPAVSTRAATTAIDAADQQLSPPPAPLLSVCVSLPSVQPSGDVINGDVTQLAQLSRRDTTEYERKQRRIRVAEIMNRTRTRTQRTPSEHKTHSYSALTDSTCQPSDDTASTVEISTASYPLRGSVISACPLPTSSPARPDVIPRTEQSSQFTCSESLSVGLTDAALSCSSGLETSSAIVS